MKKLSVVILAVAATIMSALPAQAQFHYGVVLGTEVNSMKLDKSVFDADNRAGFTGGAMIEFTVPIINVGFDLAAMYVHRVTESSLNTPQDNLSAVDLINSALTSNDNFTKRDYIEVPLNVKYKIGIPVISKVFTPYIYTGPSFAFLVSKKAITDAYQNKTFDCSWNLGIGLQFINHLHIRASYSWGMTNSVELINKYVSDTGIKANAIEGKNNYWTITAAWMF